MKLFSQVLVVAVFTLATGMVASRQTVIALTAPNKDLLLSQTQPVQPLAVSVALPALADVFVKGGESNSGQLTAINAPDQKLIIQRHGKALAIPLNQVEKVVFQNGVAVYRKNGNPIIRGERERPVGQPVSWNNLPLNTFSIQNPNQGLAIVNLMPPVVSQERLRGIQSVARDRQYVVNEIQFDSQHNTISIQATPY